MKWEDRAVIRQQLGWVSDERREEARSHQEIEMDVEQRRIEQRERDRMLSFVPTKQS